MSHSFYTHPTRDLVLQKSSSNLSNDAPSNFFPRSSRQGSNASIESKKPQDIIGFFAGLSVSMSLVATIAQEMISLYSAWERYREDGGDATDSARGAFQGSSQTRTQHAGSPYSSMTTTNRRRGSVKRMHAESRSGSHSRERTPAATEGAEKLGKVDGARMVTPLMLVQLLTQMRENRLSDLAHVTHVRPVVVDKRLERTQAAG